MKNEERKYALGIIAQGHRRLKELGCTHQAMGDGMVEVFFPTGKIYDGCHSYICMSWEDVLERLEGVKPEDFIDSEDDDEKVSEACMR